DGGEALACAAKVLRLPQRVYERILLLLDADHGASIAHVYRLAHLYETLDSHAASVMLAAMRGASFAATRAKYLPALHEDERQRARPTSSLRPALRHGASTPKTGNGATASKSATGY